MAIRRRIKDAIKKALGMQTNTSSPEVPYTEPQQVHTAVPEEPIEPEVQEQKQEVTSVPESSDVSDPPQQTNIEPPTPEGTEPESSVAEEPPEVEPTVPEAPPIAVAEPTTPSDAPPPSNTSNDADSTGASYVFNVNYLFPAECSSCGASSRNNWEREDNFFICTSCGEAY